MEDGKVGRNELEVTETDVVEKTIGSRITRAFSWLICIILIIFFNGLIVLLSGGSESLFTGFWIDPSDIEK